MLQGFYNLTEKIQDTLNLDVNVKTITYGDIFEVDLDKQTIFPLSHLIINTVNTGEQVLTFNISVMCMDVVDESKNKTTDIFLGNDNEQDVLNTQLGILDRLMALLQRGDLYSDKYQVDTDVTCEPFVDRFENKLAGWVATFDVQIQNDMTIC